MSIKFYPLSVISKRVQDLLKPAMLRPFWVKAEISSARHRGGAFYCDLIECDEEGDILAQMRCMIWESDLRRITRSFERSGLELSLEEGTAIGIECRLQFHPVYGLSLQGLHMDPAFAMGEMELKKRQIIDKLRADELLEENGTCSLTYLPNRIGLITSEGSAAYNDFVETLTHSAYGFDILLADAVMQGQQTEASVLQAMKTLRSLEPDLVVISRGGGSKSDLAWLDNEWIARAIASFPVQVWTGIGHEIDTSVLDHVSARSFKTPTAVAEELVATFEGVERQCEHAIERMRSSWNHRLREESNWLSQTFDSLRTYPEHQIDNHKNELYQLARDISHHVQNHLDRCHHQLSEVQLKLRSIPRQRVEQSRLKLDFLNRNLRGSPEKHLQNSRFELQHNFKRFQSERISARLHQERQLLHSRMSLLSANDPDQTLKRGYALLYDNEGKHIQDIEQIQPRQKFTARVKGGAFSGTIEEIET